jgi:hypothetical protein
MPTPRRRGQPLRLDRKIGRQKWVLTHLPEKSIAEITERIDTPLSVRSESPFSSLNRVAARIMVDNGPSSTSIEADPALAPVRAFDGTFGKSTFVAQQSAEIMRRGRSLPQDPERGTVRDVLRLTQDARTSRIGAAL